MGMTVTRSKRYKPHLEICAYVASESAARGIPPEAIAVKTEPAEQVDSVKVSEALADAVAAAIQEALADVDRRVEAVAQVVAEQAAAEAVKKIAPRDVQVVRDGAEPTNVGKAHRQFETLLKMAAAGVSVYICGPAGSGKTTAAEQVAAALGLKFYFNGAIDSEYKLSGFVDATGRVVSTAFRRAYTEGGVYLFDEIDASMPSAVLAFNAALAGRSADFPGETEPVKRHPDLVVMAAANTWGLGGTVEYVGRNKLDAASLDRFVMLEWDYDEDLERELTTDAAWCSLVQRLRSEAKRRGLKVVISPRATLAGCRLLKFGFTTDQALDATVFARLPQSERQTLRAAI